jgi:hypothetical protein
MLLGPFAKILKENVCNKTILQFSVDVSKHLKVKDTKIQQQILSEIMLSTVISEDFLRILALVGCSCSLMMSKRKKKVSRVVKQVCLA